MVDGAKNVPVEVIVSAEISLMPAVKSSVVLTSAASTMSLSEPLDVKAILFAPTKLIPEFASAVNPYPATPEPVRKVPAVVIPVVVIVLAPIANGSVIPIPVVLTMSRSTAAVVKAKLSAAK
jgi:hypothetical protein